MYLNLGGIEMLRVHFVLLICTTFVIMSTNLAVGADGLVGFWPFDENGGGKASDVTGNGHDGEIKGAPKWVEGKFGAALEFDGKDDYVLVPDHDALDFEKNITMMAWFSPNDVLTSRRLMVKNNSIFVIFDFGNKDSIDFLVKPDNLFAESTTTEWKVGEWYHFAGTFDGKKLRVYVNGKLEGEAANSTPIAPPDLDLWIGGDDYGRPSDFFPGKIDEVRIYDKTLTQADIQKIMDTPQDVHALGKLTTTWGSIKSR